MGAGGDSPGARALLLNPDTVAAQETGLQGRGRKRTPGSGPLMRYRRDRRTQRGLDPPSFKRCPVLLYGGTLEAQGAASFRGPSGGRPSPTWGARRWGRGRLLPRTQRAPTLPRPGDQRVPTRPHPGGSPVGTGPPLPGEPTGADPPPSWGRNGRRPPPPGDPAGADLPPPGRRPSSSRGTTGRRPPPASGTQRA